jgi:S1-C subfamily serine protease
MYEPPTGLVLLEVRKTAGLSSAPDASAAPVAGELAVGFGRVDGREIAVPLFVTSVSGDEYAIGGAQGVFPGMPIFNLGAQLLGIIVADDRGFHAVPIRRAGERLLARVAAGERQSSFGLEFQVPADRLRAIVGDQGVIISQVIPQGPADAADLRVGDVLLAVGDVELDSTETALRALQTADVDSPTSLRIRRGSRVRDVSAVATPAYDMAVLARAMAEPSAPEARQLFPESVLAASGIAAAAQVISVNGHALTSRVQVQRALRAARRPIPALVRQDRSQFFVALEPAE